MEVAKCHFVDIVIGHYRYKIFKIERQTSFRNVFGNRNVAVPNQSVHTSRPNAVGDVWKVRTGDQKAWVYVWMRGA
jgi:hypothetical protein